MSDLTVAWAFFAVSINVACMYALAFSAQKGLFSLTLIDFRHLIV
jgi:hypothetical protein